MTVLTKLVQERQEWVNRQKVLVARHNHARMVTEYVMMVILCMLPYIAFMFWDRITALIRSLL
ncbi:MAG: hypothetical protein PHR77_18745 [Kiritimatiellae bacterium]|nr:hypothetical protein [Kiritimatiellia bacterium]MDD5520819.1 hypothetical protein [Kiritimatiellia bacterium]